MEELSIADERLTAALDKHDQDLKAMKAKLDHKHDILKDRLAELNRKKHKTTQANGNLDATDGDLIEVNAGGKIIAAKRSTLTQLKGTRLEVLFSGRWEKRLQRDSDGRIFLDVNSVCFQAIVDYLNELAISSDDDPPDYPSVDAENKHILQHQLELFGLTGLTVPKSDSDILNKASEDCLHSWLEEDDVDGTFNLLYRGSRDGLSPKKFHSMCDNKGCTITVIEINDGCIVGGYSNVAWSKKNRYCVASKAFLFALDGGDVSSPCKMKLKDANSSSAVYHGSDRGPAFGGGHDLVVCRENNVTIAPHGYSYEPWHSQHIISSGSFCHQIKEMEVFQVAETGASSQPTMVREEKPKCSLRSKMQVKAFSKDINDAMNAKLETLLQADANMTILEDSFKDEQKFIAVFASDDSKAVINLNVSGTIMATKRSTLCTAKESVLAQQFDSSKWTEQGCNAANHVKDWSPDDVNSWIQKIRCIPDDVLSLFKEHKITGYELLALKKDGLTMLGITRPGTLCVLLEEIKKLEKASHDFVTLIEHSPYCFGKILDYLRLKQLHSQGLLEEPALPSVCDSQKKRFEKVVKYYFPGDGAKFILG